MKSIFPICFLVFSFITDLISQNNADTLFLNLKNSKIQISNNGYYLNTSLNNSGITFLTDTSPISLIYKAAPWISFQDSVGNTYMFSNTYSSYDIPGIYEAVNDANWNRFWKVNGSDIEKLIEDYNDGIIDSVIPADILTWPARGNTYTAAIGITIPDRNLAPFYDKDQNGLYDPYKGDYPLPSATYTGQLPEFFAWNTFIKKFLVYSLEMHQTIYTYNQDDTILGANTIYYNIEYFNWILNFIDGTVGTFLDPDIAYPYNDGCGTDTSSNTIYCYNQDSIEKYSTTSGEKVIGPNLPICTYTWLSHPMKYSMWYFNGSGDNLSDPGDFIEENRILHAHWRNNLPLRRFDRGYSLDESYPVSNYIFPDLPEEPGGWYLDPSAHVSGDIRVVTAIKSDKLKYGETFAFDFFLKSYDYHLPNRPHIEKALADVRLIKENYNNHLLKNKKITHIINKNELEVFPNPASDKIFFNDLSLRESKVQIFNINGNKIIEMSLASDASLNISSLPRGMYILKVITDNKSPERFAKIIIE